MRKIILTIFFSFLLLSSFSPNTVKSENQFIPVYFFYLQGCSHCAAEKILLNELEQKYPQLDIKRYEISNEENFKLYQQKGEEYNVPEQLLAVGTVPLTVIEEKYYLGYDEKTTGQEIKDYIFSLVEGQGNSCLKNNYPKIINFFGKEIEISSQNSLASLAVIFGLVDGINPCMFSVLLMLLTYLLAISSSRKAIIAGLIFGLCVFLIYFSLMVVLYKSLCLFHQSLTYFVYPMKIILGFVLLLIGLWMAKDFFLFKKDQKVSLAIPEFAHSIIEKLVSFSTIPAVILLALFSSLVELPCTFALPFGYTTILTERTNWPYFYLILYNLFFILPLLIITITVGFGFSRIERIKQWREKSKTIMRLAAGLLLILLGVAFLFNIF